jgi:hypothetical protein
MFRRWWAVLIMVAISCVIVAAAIAAVLCQRYWGYVLSPPGVNPRVLAATRLVAFSRFNTAPSFYIEPRGSVDLSPFASLRDGDGAWRFVGPAIGPQAWKDDWVRRGAIPPRDEVPPISAERCLALPALLESTGELIHGPYGDGFPDPRAHLTVMELLGPAGERLLFVALRTGELSNDHLAYYELLYDDSVTPPRLIDRRQWFFDVAGMERVEFAQITLAFALGLVSAALPCTAGVLLYRGLSKGARVASGRCPKCGYDLRRNFGSGCSECGWGAGEEHAAERDLRRYTFAGRAAGVVTRPPHWRTFVMCATAAALVWYGRSMPGNVHWANVGGVLLLMTAAALVLVKGVGIWMRAPWLEPLGRARYAILRFAGAIVVMLAVSLGLVTPCPLHWRFAMSKSSLERSALAAEAAGFPLAAPTGAGSMAGLYKIRRIERTSDGKGIVVWVGDAGGEPIMRSFVWYPHGQPRFPMISIGQIELFDELAPGWYIWNYQPR